MKQIIQSKSLAIGLAMFSMFFGAGNIIFPLALGQCAGDKTLFASLGLILTAAIIPIAGVIAMILFDGNHRHFFGRLGKVPGFLLALCIISLLGPLGSTPRCIALAYTTLKMAFLQVGPVFFSAAACALIFLCTMKKKHVMTILGWVLTPILLVSLITIIAIGLFTTPDIQCIDQTKLDIFFQGLKEGYNTMDLLAAFFFSSTILTSLKNSNQQERDHFRTAIKASLIGAALLACIYIGFSTIASFHGAHIVTQGKDQLLSAITMRLAGPFGGVLVCIAIALACLTTAIALISAFVDFVQCQVFREKISYKTVLAGSLAITFCVSIFQFTQISAILGPILQICYPGLIVLTLLNIAHRLMQFKPIKTPVFCAFACSAAYFFLA